MLCDEKALQGYMWIENENKVDDIWGSIYVFLRYWFD